MNRYKNVLRLLNWKNEEYKRRLEKATYENKKHQTLENDCRIKHYAEYATEYQQAIEVLEREGGEYTEVPIDPELKKQMEGGK